MTTTNQADSAATVAYTIQQAQYAEAKALAAAKEQAILDAQLEETLRFAEEGAARAAAEEAKRLMVIAAAEKLAREVE